jgi:hypothetical protein
MPPGQPAAEYSIEAAEPRRVREIGLHVRVGGKQSYCGSGDGNGGRPVAALRKFAGEEQQILLIAQEIRRKEGQGDVTYRARWGSRACDGWVDDSAGGGTGRRAFLSADRARHKKQKHTGVHQHENKTPLTRGRHVQDDLSG